MAQQRTPNPIELYEAAVQGFRQTLTRVRPAQMNSPTPCTLWNVQALIDHNLKVTGFVQGVLTGNVTTDPFASSGPLPPEGALAALDTGVARVLELIKAPGALAKELNTPFGRQTGAQFMFAPFLDLLIHKWDLAKATSQNTRLDRGLVEACYAGLLPMAEGMRNPQVFGPAVSVPENASLQDKLIALTGRQP